LIVGNAAVEKINGKVQLGGLTLKLEFYPKKSTQPESIEDKSHKGTGRFSSFSPINFVLGLAFLYRFKLSNIPSHVDIAEIRKLFKAYQTQYIKYTIDDYYNEGRKFVYINFYSMEEGKYITLSLGSKALIYRK
jgi:hypothetical protein